MYLEVLKQRGFEYNDLSGNYIGDLGEFNISSTSYTGSY